MNTRIRELAEQAETYAGYYAMLSETGEKEIFIKKFAQLIASDIVGAIRGLQLSAQEDGMLNVAGACETIAGLIEIDYGVGE
jgi:hypothetical protein